MLALYYILGLLNVDVSQYEYAKFIVFRFLYPFTSLDRKISMRIRRELSNEEVSFIDIGCNYGQSSWRICHLFGDLKAYIGIDPNLRALEVTRKIILRNYPHLGDSLSLLPYCLSDDNKDIRLYLPYFKHFLLSGLVSADKSSILKCLNSTLGMGFLGGSLLIRELIAQSISSTDFVSHIDMLANASCLFLKIDVQGMESKILVDLLPKLSSHRPIYILVEHELCDTSPILRNLHFALLAETRNDQLWVRRSIDEQG